MTQFAEFLWTLNLTTQVIEYRGLLSTVDADNVPPGGIETHLGASFASDHVVLYVMGYVEIDDNPNFPPEINDIRQKCEKAAREYLEDLSTRADLMLDVLRRDGLSLKEKE